MPLLRKIGSSDAEVHVFAIAWGNPEDNASYVDLDTPLPVNLVGTLGGPPPTTFVDNAVGQTVDVSVLGTVLVDNAVGQTVDVSVLGTVLVDNAVGQTVDVSVVGPVVANLPVVGVGTSRSGTITSANVSQILAAANLNRVKLRIQNISAGSLGVNEDGAAAALGSAGTYTVAAGAFLDVLTNKAVSVVGGTIAQAWTATEI